MTDIDIDKTRSQISNRSTGPKAVRVLGLLFALAALFFVTRRAGGYLPQFAEWVDGLDFWGPLVFIVGYAISTVGFVPEYLLVIVVVTTVRLHELYDMARGMAVTSSPTLDVRWG